MAMEQNGRKAIRNNTVLKAMAFTDNENHSVFDTEYFEQGNTYLRDLTILKAHMKSAKEKHVSTGSTCLVYEGRLGDLDVIVKEFYPETENGFFYVERVDDETQQLKVHEIKNTNFCGDIMNRKNISKRTI